MTEDQQTQRLRNNIVWAIFLLGMTAIIGGTVLTFKGYNAELLIGGGTGSITGLLGVLGFRQNPTPPPPPVIQNGNTNVL